MISRIITVTSGNWIVNIYNVFCKWINVKTACHIPMGYPLMGFIKPQNKKAAKTHLHPNQMLQKQ